MLFCLTEEHSRKVEQNVCKAIFLFILSFTHPITFVSAADAAGKHYTVFLVQSITQSQRVAAVQQSVCSHGEEIRGKSIFAYRVQ